MRKLLPLHIRMCLMFLFRREKEFTEADMTQAEIDKLKLYAETKEGRHMYLAFGKIRFSDNIIEDLYNFEPVPNTSLLNIVVNLLCLYQKTGYEGYKVRITL